MEAGVGQAEEREGAVATSTLRSSISGGLASPPGSEVGAETATVGGRTHHTAGVGKSHEAALPRDLAAGGGTGADAAHMGPAHEDLQTNKMQTLL